MAVTGREVVAEARRWIGTPYHLQQRLCGVGCDCVGLIVGVGLALGLIEAHGVPADYRAEADPRLVPELDRLFRRQVGLDAAPGDILLMWVDGRSRAPQHLAIVSECDTVIHGLATGGIRRIAEHRLDRSWRERRLGVWRYPGVDV